MRPPPLAQGRLLRASSVRDALIKSTCADWRADFSSDEARKAQEYFVYFKLFGQSQAEKMPSRHARGFIQRILRRARQIAEEVKSIVSAARKRTCAENESLL